MCHIFYEIRAPKPIYFYFSLKIDRLPLFFIRGFTRRLPPLPLPPFSSQSPRRRRTVRISRPQARKGKGGKRKRLFCGKKEVSL